MKSVGVDTKTGYYNHRSYDGTQKNISIQSWSNVDATVKVAGGSSYSISAEKSDTRTIRLIGGKYTVTLKDKKGKILDQESHNRKTGL